MSEPYTVGDEHGNVKLSKVKLNDGLTVMCHREGIQIINDRDDVLSITPESTLAMAAKFKPETWAKAKADADFMSRLQMIFGDMDFTVDKRELADYPIAVRHVVGLIICTNMAVNTGRKPYWVYPETYLHPSSQANLGCLAIRYQKEAEAAYARPCDPAV